MPVQFHAASGAVTGLSGLCPSEYCEQQPLWPGISDRRALLPPLSLPSFCSYCWMLVTSDCSSLHGM